MSKEKLLIGIILIFFVFFLVILFAEANGYYDTSTTRAKVLTEEQIKKFEKDIEEGKKIDIKEYVVSESQDYSNKLSKGIYNISLKIEGLIDKSIKKAFKKVSETIEN